MDNLWPLFLVEVAATFQVSVGAAGLISTFNALAMIVFGLLVGFFSIQFKHRSLLFAGLVFMIVAALGCYWAPSLGLLQVFNFLNGAGSVMVGAMAITLVGTFLPIEKRGTAVGVLQASPYLALLIGLPLTSLIAGVQGWRSVLIFLQLPISVAALVLAVFGLPGSSHEPQQKVDKTTFFGVFKQVLFCRSPAGCLVGHILRSIGAFAISLYVVSFFKQEFLVSDIFGASILVVSTLIAFFSNLVAGRLVNRFGRKPLTVVTTLIWSALIAVFFFVPNLWLCLILFFTGYWFGGMAQPASMSLTLEQVPKSRGTMVSWSVVFIAIGAALGTAFGGAIIDAFSYQFMGVIAGVIGFAAGMTYYFATKDPSKVA